MEQIWFAEQQLFWLEELDPAYFVETLVYPAWYSNLAKPVTPLTAKPVRLGELEAFKQAYAADNIWRSWNVFRSADFTEILGPVPVVLDIDSETPASRPGARLRDHCGLPGCPGGRQLRLPAPVTNEFGTGSLTYLDTLTLKDKPWVRLPDTRYTWISEHGELHYRRILSMTVEEFRGRGLAGILAAAEKA